MHLQKPSILEVKQKHELSLLQYDGVEGVGITREKGEEVIVIYCSNEAIRKKLPKKLDGYTVKIQKTGSFRAF